MLNFCSLTLWCRGPARHPFMVKIEGSNPSRVATKSKSTRLGTGGGQGAQVHNADPLPEVIALIDSRLALLKPIDSTARDGPSGMDRAMTQAWATQAPCCFILNPLLTGGKVFSA